MGVFGSLTTSYRTGVTYDFSIVEKAVIHVLDMAGESIKHSLPVQINPSDITDGTSLRESEDHMDPESHSVLKFQNRNSDDSTFSATLIYSMYDEYNIRTMDGMLSVGGTVLGGQPHLKNRNVTSLPLLQASVGCRVAFIWGEMKVVGQLKSVEPTYKYFSRWGEPLRADVPIVIAKEHPGLDSDGIAEDPLSLVGMLVKTEIKAYSLASRVLNEAALIASQALR